MSRTVLITGGGARIGRALTLGLAQDGWAVVIHYFHSEDEADDLASNIRETGGTACAIGANLNIPGELDSLVDRASAKLGSPLTALINNASTFENDNAETFSHALFDHHMDINLRAPLRLSQHFAAQLPEGQSGSILNLIDQRVLKPNPLFFTYSMSKAALYWSTKTLAQALAPHIRVNGIGPGPTLQNKDQTRNEFVEEASTTLLGYESAPDAIVEAAKYLLNARSVTGQMLAVDSGQHLTWKTQDLLVGLDENGGRNGT